MQNLFYKQIRLLLAIILFFLSCTKKSDTVVDNIIKQTTPAIPINFPLTTGTWWKYAKIDSSFIWGYQIGSSVPKYRDITVELITVAGLIKLAVGSDAYLLDIQNLTNKKRDTNYFVPVSGDFRLYTKEMIDVSPPSYSYFSTSVYVSKSYFNPDSIISHTLQSQTNEFSFYRIDSSINVSGKIFSPAIYVLKKHFTNPIGAQKGLDYTFAATIAQGIGFVKYESMKYDGNGFGGYQIYLSREILDYYIAP